METPVPKDSRVVGETVRRSSGSARAVQRRTELLVNLDLISGDELVGLVGHPNDGLQLCKHGVGHALLESGGGVRSDAVMAVVGDADGDVKQFLGERIER